MLYTMLVFRNLSVATIVALNFPLLPPFRATTILYYSTYA